MAAHDMLDVLHYYFEQDSVGEEDLQKAKTRMREELYTRLYKRPYSWGNAGGPEREFGTQEIGTDGFHNKSGQPELTHKPFVPTTKFNPDAARPYGTLLDPPLG